MKDPINIITLVGNTANIELIASVLIDATGGY